MAERRSPHRSRRERIEPDRYAARPEHSGRAFVFEIKAISIPGVTDEVVNGTETIERASELTAEEGVEALSTARLR